MSLFSLLRSSPSASRNTPVHRAGQRLRVEGLEDRYLLSASLVKDIVPGPGNSNPRELVRVDDQIYFFSATPPQNQLCKSDGTAAGTNCFVTIRTEILTNALNGLTNVNGTLYFWSTPTFGTLGRLLWKSDGTAAGTVVHHSVGGLPARPASISRLTASGDRLFFVEHAPSLNPPHRLRVTDGTTNQILFQTAFPSGEPSNLANVNGTVFFSAEGNPSFGRELYKTDGTVAGTGLVKNINPTGASDPRSLTNVGGLLYFSADDGEHGRELWVSDGTDAGTRMVADLNPGPASSDPQNLIEGFGTYALFSADTPGFGREPWVCCFDGVTPTQIADINPGAGSSNPQNLIADAAGFLYLSADDGSHGRELWFSDWTPAGTRLVKDVRPGPLGSDPQKLTFLYGYYLYFTADDGTSGRELWASDGSELYTELIADIDPGPGSSNPDFLLEMPDAYVYFAATGPASVGRELYRTSPFFAGPGGAPGGGRAGDAARADGESVAQAAPTPEDSRSTSLEAVLSLSVSVQKRQSSLDQLFTMDSPAAV